MFSSHLTRASFTSSDVLRYSLLQDFEKCCLPFLRWAYCVCTPPSLGGSGVTGSRLTKAGGIGRVSPTKSEGGGEGRWRSWGREDFAVSPNQRGPERMESTEPEQRCELRSPRGLHVTLMTSMCSHKWPSQGQREERAWKPVSHSGFTVHQLCDVGQVITSNQRCKGLELIRKYLWND